LLVKAIRRFTGIGTAPDEAAAATCLRRGALAGNPVAMNRYARLLALGRGVEPNEIEAAKWHLIAREAGVSDLWLDGFVGSREPFVLKEAQRRAERT
jgi:TPR repeat protein